MDLAFQRLTSTAFGYWQAQCLFALVEHRVFDRLAEGPATCGQLVDDLGLDADVAERVLDAGVALGYLTKQNGRYANSGTAQRLLLDTSPDGLAHWVRAMGQWSRPWSRLPEAMRVGRIDTPEDTGGADRRDFILGMHEFARRAAAALPEAAALTDPKRLIDVGGGAGTYAIAFCQAHAALRATVLDLPEVLEITAQTAVAAGLGGRIEAAAVDYRSDPLGSGADAVLFSNVLHQESEEVVIGMLRRGAAALADPGEGRILVHGHFLSDDRTHPLFSTLHNISAVLLWGTGSSYTVEQMRALMRRAGLDAGQPRAVPGSTSELLVGTIRKEPAR